MVAAGCELLSEPSTTRCGPEVCITREQKRRWKNTPSTTSSPAPARPGAASPRGSARTAATGCCCSKPAPDDRYWWIHVPIGYSRLFANPRVNWMFESEPEPELEGRTMYQPRGKVLGGTSSINGMVYMRGNPADYDLWRQRGCTGWDWDSVLPYFRKAEDQERGADADPRRRRAAARLRPGGPLGAGRPFHRRRGRSRAAGQQRLQRRRAGRRRARSRTPPTASGAGAPRRPTCSRRAAAPTSRSAPTRTRPGSWSRTAAPPAIEFLCDGVPHVARARGEIVVCGGVYGSPQLLQLSGHRAGRDAAAIRHPGGARHARGRRRSAGPFLCPPGVPLHPAAHPQRHRQQPGEEAGRRACSTCSSSKGPLTSNGICAGGFAQQRPAARPARHPAQFQRLELCRAHQPRRRAASPSRLHDQRGASAARRARRGHAEKPRPAGRAVDPLQLSEDPLRFGGADRRHAPRPQDHAAAGAGAIMSRRSCCRAPRSTATPSSRPRSGATASPTCTRSAPAAWARTRRRCAIRASRSTASPGCASSTPR